MNSSEIAVISAFKTGALLTVKQIHDLAPDAKRVAYTVERLAWQGLVRVAGLRHSIERGPEVIYSLAQRNVNE